MSASGWFHQHHPSMIKAQAGPRTLSRMMLPVKPSPPKFNAAPPGHVVMFSPHDGSYRHVPHQEIAHFAKHLGATVVG